MGVCTFSWLGWFRRLTLDNERYPKIAETMVYINQNREGPCCAASFIVWHFTHTLLPDPNSHGSRTNFHFRNFSGIMT